MKQFHWIILALFAGILTLGADDNKTETLELLYDSSFERVVTNWHRNGQGGDFKQVPAGRTGACLRITNRADQRTALYTSALIPLNPEKDVLKISIRVKGKGSFTIGGYLYGIGGRPYVSSFSSRPPVKVDSSEWEKKEFVFKPASFSKKARTLRLVIEALKGEADLYFDDLSGVKETPLP